MLALIYFFAAAIVTTYTFEFVRGWWSWARKLEDSRIQEEASTVRTRSARSTRSLSIVIPAYNEEKRLPSVLRSTIEYLMKRRDKEGSSFTYEIVVVDDGSTDQTAVKAWLCAKELGAEDAVRVFQTQVNSGKGAAVRTGCLKAEGDLVLMMDADGATELEHGLEALEFAMCTRLMKKAKSAKGQGVNEGYSRVTGSGKMGRGEKTGHGIIQEAGGYSFLSKQTIACFGSRAHLEQEDIVTKRTKIRNFAMHGFHLLVFLVVGGSIRDTQCGFKLFTRETALALFRNQRLKRWCFDVEIVSIAQRLKVPILEAQVKWQEKEGSKLKILHVFHMLLELCTILAMYRLGFWRVTGMN